MTDLEDAVPSPPSSALRPPSFLLPPPSAHRQLTIAMAEVSCPCGVAVGAIEGSTRVFKSMPFATAGRWEQPALVTDWPSPIDAMSEQLAAYQRNQPQPDDVHQTEDCLTVTVRSPVGASNLPVMCWIHGGNHQDGRAEQPAEPHANELPDKGVVLVKINYRLGLFGYFAHPDLSSTNFGTSDQVIFYSK